MSETPLTDRSAGASYICMNRACEVKYMRYSQVRLKELHGVFCSLTGNTELYYACPTCEDPVFVRRFKPALAWKAILQAQRRAFKRVNAQKRKQDGKVLPKQEAVS